MRKDPQCTCRNSTLPWGSFYCRPKWAAMCRKQQDKDWWKKVTKKRKSTKKPRLTKSMMQSVLRDAERKMDRLQGLVNSHELTITNMKANYRNLHQQFDNLSNPNWKMGTGEFIRVSQMEDGHLRNAISYCTRRLLGAHAGLSGAVYLENLTRYIEGLANLLKEAKRRNIRV